MKTMGYNILILHNLLNFTQTLKSAADYVLCFERYAPEHTYLYHQISAPETAALKDIRFDAVILDATALGFCRYRPRELYESEKDRWSFVGASDAVKLAFPQDDYHQSNTLDTLFDEWNFDWVYTVLPRHTDAVYPRMTAKGRLSLVLTGYVDDMSLHEFEPFARPFGRREIDIGQRVQFYSPLGGRYALLKGRLAEAVKAAALVKGMRTDISTAYDERKAGDDWLQFLGNCRFVPGSESGVSVWDPDGFIYDRVNAYVDEHPDAAFEEIEAACFPGEDGRYIFSAVSPRLFEAAMMRCGQVLVEGAYLGVLKPFEHYIPVKPDLSPHFPQLVRI
ncbi:MAG: hypothetical protein IH870_00635 [Chloroflexi bacterium]|nr:hypothetical protein [Chloroflexota bacterium]